MLTMVLVLLGYLAVLARGRAAQPRSARSPVALVTAALLYTQYWAFFLVGRRRRDPAVDRVARPGRAAQRPRCAIILRDGRRRPALRPVAADVRCTRCSTPERRGTRPTSPPTNTALGHHRLRRRPHDRGLDDRPAARAARAARAVRTRARPVADRRRPAHVRRGAVGVARRRAHAVRRALALVPRGQRLPVAVRVGDVPALRARRRVRPHRARRPPDPLRRARVHRRWSASSAACATSSRTAPRRRRSPTRSARAAKPGDVVAYCPDQLGPDVVAPACPTRSALKQYTFPTFESPKFVDWVDYEDRNNAASPDAYAHELLRASGQSQDLVRLVHRLPDVRRQVRADPQRPRRGPRPGRDLRAPGRPALRVHGAHALPMIREFGRGVIRVGLAGAPRWTGDGTAVPGCINFARGEAWSAPSRSAVEMVHRDASSCLHADVQRGDEHLGAPPPRARGRARRGHPRARRQQP